MKTDRKDEYSAFQATLIRRVGGSVALSITIVMAMYLLFWKRRMGNWIVWFLQNILQMDFYDAYNFYGDYFRGNKDRFFIAAITIVVAVLLWRVFRGMTRYFEEINQGKLEVPCCIERTDAAGIKEGNLCLRGKYITAVPGEDTKTVESAGV